MALPIPDISKTFISEIPSTSIQYDHSDNDIFNPQFNSEDIPEIYLPQSEQFSQQNVSTFQYNNLTQEVLLELEIKSNFFQNEKLKDTRIKHISIKLKPEYLGANTQIEVLPKFKIIPNESKIFSQIPQIEAKILTVILKNGQFFDISHEIIDINSSPDFSRCILPKRILQNSIYFENHTKTTQITKMQHLILTIHGNYCFFNSKQTLSFHAKFPKLGQDTSLDIPESIEIFPMIQ